MTHSAMPIFVLDRPLAANPPATKCDKTTTNHDISATKAALDTTQHDKTSRGSTLKCH